MNKESLSNNSHLILGLFSDGLRNKQPIADTDYECGGPFQNFGHPPQYHANSNGNNNFVNPVGGPNAMLHGGNGHMGSHGGGMMGPNSGGPSMILNPIDRLYSMQNLYFCGEKMADEQI